ncbi:MAG: YdeI/OmpD-associated family protein [Longimicrobiales bacterium]
MSKRRSLEPRDVAYFQTPAAFRAWLEENHATADVLWVGFHKKATGRPSITWPQSVDEALCFGWIDGIRKSIDDEAYAIRFTPRKPNSTWSRVNARRAEELLGEGRMRPAGVAAFEKRDARKTETYSYERENAAFGPEQEERMRANGAAWAFFSAQPPGYRKLATHWVVSAKREPTRERRLQALIADSAAGRRIGLLRRPGDKPEEQ